MGIISSIRKPKGTPPLKEAKGNMSKALGIFRFKRIFDKKPGRIL